MIKGKNKELIRQIGFNPNKPDNFQIVNQPLMNNLSLWSQEIIDFQEIIQTFFAVKVRTKIIAVLLDLDINNWVGIAGSWQHSNHTGQIRLDSKLSEFLLNKAFGESPINRPFNVKKLNHLELEILQMFLSALENKMKTQWEVDSKHPFLMDLIYLVWIVESDDQEIGRIAYGMPASFRPKTPKKIDTNVIDIQKLANTGIKVPVNFHAGNTRLSVKELRSLESDDLVIFEDSDTSKFDWHLGEISLVLPEEDHPVFIKEIENIQELAEEMQKFQNKDDDPISSLPLELSAEFQKVLIPLKQVLELKSGGVLPLGSVLDSELVLTAQGKPVAKGELVIIGNQFGMRITELLIGVKKTGKGSVSGIAPGGGVELDDLFPSQPAQQAASPLSDEPLNFADELEELEEN